MPHYEYRVVPAPTKGQKAKGVRGHENRFAYALQDLMNRMGAEGWEYQRAETLPSEERHGLTSVTTTYPNVLVFRRPVAGTDDAFVTRLSIFTFFHDSSFSPCPQVCRPFRILSMDVLVSGPLLSVYLNYSESVEHRSTFQYLE